MGMGMGRSPLTESEKTTHVISCKCLEGRFFFFFWRGFVDIVLSTSLQLPDASLNVVSPFSQIETAPGLTRKWWWCVYWKMSPDASKHPPGELMRMLCGPERACCCLPWLAATAWRGLQQSKGRTRLNFRQPLSLLSLLHHMDANALRIVHLVYSAL